MYILMRRYVRKRAIGHMRPAKFDISLCIPVFCSESSLGTFWIAKGVKFLHKDNEDSGQTSWMRRLIRVFIGRSC